MQTPFVRISSISENLDCVPTVAQWHWTEWGHTDPRGSLESWTTGLKERTNPNRIPATYLAFEDNTPIGTAVLVEHDMDTRMDLSPWLAGVYVRPEHRGRGVASALCTHAMREAERFGARVLYLYSGSAVPLYQRLGWQEFGTEFYEGRDVVLMRTVLGS